MKFHYKILLTNELRNNMHFKEAELNHSFALSSDETINLSNFVKVLYLFKLVEAFVVTK